MKTLFMILSILFLASPVLAGPFLEADVDEATETVQLTIDGVDRGEYVQAGALVRIDLGPFSLPDGELVFTKAMPHDYTVRKPSCRTDLL